MARRTTWRRLVRRRTPSSRPSPRARTNETCKADVAGGDALAAYDALAARLDTAPITFDFTTSTGTTESRQLTIADLENAAFNALYNSDDRLLLQRAIAAASHDDLVPLAKLGYSALGLNPDTLVAEVDPGYSDAMYYAVECQDYAFFPDAGDAGCPPDRVGRRRRGRGHRWHPSRDRLLRRCAVPLLADGPDDLRATRADRGSAVPGLRPDLDDRSGDADRQRHAHLLEARRRLLRPDGRRAARHLSPGARPAPTT